MRYLDRSPLFWVILGVSCSITVLAVFWDSRLSFGGKHILYICSALAAFGLAIYFRIMEKKNKKEISMKKTFQMNLIKRIISVLMALVIILLTSGSILAKDSSSLDDPIFFLL